MQVPRIGTRSRSWLHLIGSACSLLWRGAAHCRLLSVSTRNSLCFSPRSELILQFWAGKPEEHRSGNNLKTNFLVLLQMEQMYTSTALKLGYDAVQKFTPKGDLKVCEFFQVLDFRRYLRCSYKKSKNMNLVFRHVSFTEVVSSQWVLIKTKSLQNFPIVSEPSKQGYS